MSSDAAVYLRVSSSSDGPCKVCADLDVDCAVQLAADDEDLEIEINGVHRAAIITTQWSKIVDAASQRCGPCMLLRACISLFQDEFALRHNTFIGLTFHQGRTMMVTVETERVLDEGSSAIELFVIEDEHSPWPTLGRRIEAINQSEGWSWHGGVASIVPSDPLSHCSIASITEWLELCNENHPWCSSEFRLPGQQTAQRHVYPKRLLSVGLDDNSVRLCETGEDRSPYLALSYCWGRSQGLRCSTANVLDLLTTINTAELVQTIRDAIKVTRIVGFEYIWVDSLCIVQDDPHDWASEAANMGSVYSNAHITIAATSASDGDSGMLHPRQETKSITLIDEAGNRSCVYARQAISHKIFEWNVDTETLDHAAPAHKSTAMQSRTPPAETRQFPLLSRGWAFQERLLSRRILHFTQNEIVWECLGSSSCECGSLKEYVGCGILTDRHLAARLPRDIEILTGNLRRAEALAKSLFSFDVQFPLDAETCDQIVRYHLNPVHDKDEALLRVLGGANSARVRERDANTNRWQSLVCDYTLRNLSYRSDSLPALSGLANRWRDQYHDRYHAGLWETNLLRDLLWQCIDKKPVDRAGEYVAPSWSWASVERAVTFLPSNFSLADNEQPTYRVSDLHVHTTTSSVDPCGKVLSGQLRLRGPVAHAELRADKRLGTHGLALIYFVEKKDSVDSQPPDCIFKPDSIPGCKALHGQRVFVLWYCKDSSDSWMGPGSERALILRKSSGEPSNHFHRMGLMEDFPAHLFKHKFVEQDLVIV